MAAPEPMAVLATNQQLKDMVRFLTDPQQHTVMGIDPTFNFGEFNVTPIAFHSLANRLGGKFTLEYKLIPPSF